MSTYTDILYIERDFTSSNLISLSYKELMSDLRDMVEGTFYNTYLKQKSEDGDENSEENVISDDQKLVNEKIEKISSFNITAYAVIKRRNEDAHKTVKFDIDTHNYKHLKINGYYLDTPISTELDDDPVDPSNTLTALESVFFNNTQSLEIEIDNKFLQYDKNGNVVVDDEGKPVYGSIKKGDYFYLYFIIGTITNPEGVTTEEFLTKRSGQNAELYYKFTYNPADENEDEDKDENTDSQNDWIVVPDEDLDAGPFDYDLYYISDARWKDYIFLNTVTVTDLETLPNNTLRCHDNITRVFISPLCPVSFTFQLRVVSTVKKTTRIYTFNYVPKTLNVTKPHLKRAIKMNNPDVSYALLRTNPKLTGNVKVVVDENSNIYIDTFKVSNALSQRKYRHIKVGSDSYYGSTLVKYFKDMPTTDFYNVESKCYSLFSTVQTYQDQFYDMYRYGVKTNDDELYSENYALLAPLCIKRVIPDFFLIFRVDKDDIYNETSMSNAEKIQYFLSKGVLIKSYDMRINSPLGTYARNIYEHSKNEPGDMYVSYSTDNLNKFIGISLDKGVVSSIYESAYNDANIKSQVALNDFYTNGFERNHIVSRNIINFEFMFNDPDVEAFSLNTYFGLYVKVNEQEESFSCIGIGKDGEYIFDSSVYTFDDIYLSTSKLNTLIYGLTTPEKFIRLNTGLNHNPILNDYVKKPYKNLLITRANKVNLKNFKSFITVNFNKRLEVGDHYRIIDTLNDIIYEVILCDIDNAIDLQYMDYNNLPGHNDHNLSDVITNYYNEFGVKFEIKRVAVYTHYRDYQKDTDESNEILKTQVEQIYYAFRKLGDENITSYKYNDNSISFVSNVSGTLFERICAASGFDNTLKQYVYETNDEKDTISYFGYLPGHKIVLDLSTLDTISHSVPLWKTRSYSYLYPIHFEIAGNRMADVYGFIDIAQIGDGENIYECEIKEKDLDIFNTKTILYNSKDKDKSGNIQREVYNSLIINTFVNDDNLLDILMTEKEVKYVQSFNDLNKYILNTKNPLLKNNSISLYNSYPLNSGVCSIFNLKDFDFNVLDNKSIIKSSDSGDKIGDAGEYSRLSIFTTRPFNETEEEEIEMVKQEEEQIDYSTKESNKFGDPFCYKDAIIKINELVNYEFSEHDQILKYGEEKYVIKHCTLEEYVTLLKMRLLFFRDKNITQSGKYYITTDDYEKLLDTIGLNRFGNYSGIILRPFAGIDSVAYNESYEYFNHFVNYKEKHLENNIKTMNYIGLQSDKKYIIKRGEDEYECYLWLGFDSFISRISVNDFDLEKELTNSDYENPEVLYEDPEVLNSICPSSSIVKENTTEESFINYIDKFKKYTEDDFILVGTNKNTNRTSYLKNMYKLNHNRFDISLTCPYVCKWKSIGTDARIDNLRLMYDYSSLKDKKSYYIVNESDFNGYLGILYLQNKNEVINPTFGKKYINRSLDDVLFIDKKHMGKYERDFILSGDGALDDILYDSVSDENKFSIAYTQGIGTLEFISGGIKFRVKSNNTDILDFAKYNGYSVAFVSLPIKNIASETSLELIIDETRCEIMLVWYCYTNSLEYGVKMRVNLTNDLDNNVEVLAGLIASKINYTETLSDISYKPIVTDYNSYRGALIPDTMGFSEVVDKNTHDSEFLENSTDKQFTRKGQKLCRKVAYVYISNLGSDPGAYTKTNIAVITGKMFNDQPVTRTISETYPYYNEEGYLTPANPFIWHRVKDAQYNFHEDLSDTGIATYTHNLGQIKDSLLYVDDISCTPSSIRTLNDLKKSLNSCGIIIKKTTGNYDYTTVENLLTISIIDPVTYNPYTTYKRNIVDKNKLIKDTDESGHIVMHADYGDHNLNILNDEKKYVDAVVHSTYAEPVMKDMLSFYYNSSSHDSNFDVDKEEESFIENAEDIESIFNISFDGANVFIKDTNDIEQLWINKYTLNNNYCLVGTNRNIKSMLFPIDVVKNVSIMNDCNINTEFRKYTVVDNTNKTPKGGHVEDYVAEEWTTVKGYTSGVELKTFINSKALSLNTDKIEITKWKNNEVISSDKCIKLNITSSLINYILTKPSFYNIWKNINLKNDEYKVRYIKNCILKYININNKIKFELRHSKDKTNKIKCSNSYNEKGTLPYNNFKNELKFENEKYYMYVYVDELYTYYPKITIML